MPMRLGPLTYLHALACRSLRGCATDVRGAGGEYERSTIQRAERDGEEGERGGGDEAEMATEGERER